MSGKVVGAELVSWNKRVCDQELGPLVKKGGLERKIFRKIREKELVTYILGEVGFIACLLGVTQSHYDHVPTF